MNIKIKDLIISALLAALICVGAWIKIPIPYVPITLQFFFVNLAIISQKTKYSVLSVGTYIFMGLIGLPVFSGGGGISYIFAPSFGYIIGFLISALSSGIKKLKKHKLVQSLINIIIIYTTGMTYFYLITNLYLGKNYGIAWILVYCCLIFIPSDLFCVFLSLTVYKYLKRLGLFGKEIEIG